MTRSRGHQEAHTREHSNRACRRGNRLNCLPRHAQIRSCARSCLAPVRPPCVRDRLNHACLRRRARRVRGGGFRRVGPGDLAPRACRAPDESPAPTDVQPGPRNGQWSHACRAGRWFRGTQPAPDAQRPLDVVLAPAGVFEIGHRDADAHRAAARRRARQRDRGEQGADSPVAGHRAPTTSCAWSRRSACSAGPAACRPIPRRRACRCEASARAASAGRWC